MGYIQQEFFDFFSDLSKNNKREWFHENKKRYEEFVKEPFKQMIEELIFRVQEFQPQIEITPQKAIFRINRDVRFSKDKTPYKTHLSANMQNGGRTSTDNVGYYVHLGHEKVYVGGGSFHASKEGINNIRTSISTSTTDFNKLISEKKFKSTFGEIQGDRLKRIPKEFRDTFETQPIVGNKQFYFTKEMQLKDALANNFTDIVIDHYKAGSKINSFFHKALNS